MAAPRKTKGEKKISFPLSIEEKYIDGKDHNALKLVAINAIKRFKDKNNTNISLNKN